jgi:hypothetical protein
LKPQGCDYFRRLHQNSNKRWIQRGPAGLHALLPFAALIKNDTGQPIIEYTIRWNASGQAEAGELNRFDFSDFSGVVGPHETELVLVPFR